MLRANSGEESNHRRSVEIGDPSAESILSTVEGPQDEIAIQSHPGDNLSPKGLRSNFTLASFIQRWATFFPPRFRPKVSLPD